MDEMKPYQRERLLDFKVVQAEDALRSLQVPANDTLSVAQTAESIDLGD